MYYDKYGNSYKYLLIAPNGKKIYHNGLILSKKRRDRIDCIGNTWDNIHDKKKLFISKKLEQMREIKENKN